jgi:hypothetical protein
MGDNTVRDPLSTALLVGAAVFAIAGLIAMAMGNKTLGIILMLIAIGLYLFYMLRKKK